MAEIGSSPKAEREPERDSASGEDLDAIALPPANPGRPRSLVVALLGAAVAFVVMAADRRFGFAVPLGGAGVAICALGLLDALGTFDDPDPPARRSTLGELWRPLAATAAASAALVVALRLAVAGVLDPPLALAAALVTGSSLGLLGSGFWLFRAIGAFRDGDRQHERAFYEHHGLWLLAIAIALYVPLLGGFSLIDPWETHYGEVAREMLARNDWISFWWAQDGWFWSKPALTFWIEGLAFSLLGVRWEPDGMLAAAADGRFPMPEWAARFPVAVLAMGAVYFAYRAARPSAGRRAAFLGGLVLLTAPYWFFLAHQSMTDMPYVAPLTAALSLVIVGLGADPAARVPSFEIAVGRRAFRVSAAHALFGAVLVTSLPQLLYLLSRNASLVLDGASRGFALHLDEFFSGSGGGNCGLPGNEPCAAHAPVNPVFQPAVGALIWGIALGLFLFANRGERRTQRLCFLGAWYFTALALLAKGAPGLVLPLVVTIAVVALSRRFRDFARLELVGLVLLVACVALPWYAQAFMRHGSPFSDRLLFHDMYKRAFVHVHDTNTGDDVSFRYYVWQLGYGLFPWLGFAAAALAGALDPARRDGRRGPLTAFLGAWSLLGFGLFTLSLTKFHHYALPLAPPLALLAGLELDRALAHDAAPRSLLRRVASGAGLVLSALCAVLGASRLGAGSFLGAAEQGAPLPGPAPALAVALLAGAVVAFALSVRLWREPSAAEVRAEPFEAAAFGLFAVLSAALALLVGRDFWSDGGSARLLNLFSYNYGRAWPETLDFRSTLAAFAIVAAGAFAAMAIAPLRAHAARLSLAVGAVFCAFGLDAYLVALAPHWGQRETALAYYATRAGPEEPLVAYQMNWKGENFYTGNRVPAFVSSGAKFKDWLNEQREKGVRVMYFTTEHGRSGTLKHELGPVKSFQLLTKVDLNNKFFLARVEL